MIGSIWMTTLFLATATANAASRIASSYEGGPQPLGAADTGINVLLDNAHQFLFYGAWKLPPAMRAGGFRVVSSQATLDEVLVPENLVRIRLKEGRDRPFGWWKTPRFNVVVTCQVDPNAQAYLPEEIETVRRFVAEGGGLVMIGGGRHWDEAVDHWPLNGLADIFGAQFDGRRTRGPWNAVGFAEALTPPKGADTGTLQLDDTWEPLLSTASSEKPVVARRRFAKGRVVAIGDLDLLKWTSDAGDVNATFLHRMLEWVAGGSSPAGGTRRLPREAAGGGAIYPSLEADVGGVTVFYAKNQPEWMLRLLREEMPDVKEWIEQRMPSIPAQEGMYLILSAGAGGGWAVNAYRPKEVGIIALDGEAILSIFAHELAHTLYSGPPNDRGEAAGRLPSVFSEAHAGWFQGKIEALRTGKRAGHDPNRVTEHDPNYRSVDLATLTEHRVGWSKLWWVWQKLDDRYGPTWYPRWLWVKNVRWQDEPDRALSWDDVVEDMSIAVGEDLFPFFRAIGTTLEKDRYAEATFMGETFSLSPADISLTPAGTARLEPIGDYRQPLR